jgi:hypothetical protein
MLKISRRDHFFHPCSACRSTASLFRISPLGDQSELRSYECRRCLRVDQYEVSADPEAAWILLNSAAVEGGCTA